MAVDLGNFDLRRNDNDRFAVGEAVYGGEPRPDLGDKQYVRTLKDTLLLLGFRLFEAPRPNDRQYAEFDLWTEWAVREFQYYAQSPNAAQVQDTGLTQVEVAPADRYDGPVSGVANQRTRGLLALWAEREWRCPVIISHYTPKKELDARTHESGAALPQTGPANLWRWDHGPVVKSHVFAVDYSGRYGKPGGRDLTTPQVLGKYRAPAGCQKVNRGGPVSLPNVGLCWDDAEITPASCGLTIDADTENRVKSTFKVVRAGSEQECIGFFDCFNAYDWAYFSMGPCHWTIGIISRKTNKETCSTKQTGVDDGEFGGLLAYIKAASEPSAFDSLFGKYGLRPDLPLFGEGQDSAYDPSPRKAASWYLLPAEPDGEPPEIPVKSFEEGEYFRTWHWIYRFVMEARTNADFRRMMYDFARFRIREIAQAPWSDKVIPKIPDPNDPSRKVAFKLSDIFSSEKAIALALRLHIFLPGLAVSGGEVGRFLVRVYTRARLKHPKLDWTLAPRAWGKGHEQALLSTFMFLLEQSNIKKDDYSNETEKARELDLKHAGQLSGALDTFKTLYEWPKWYKAAKPGEADSPPGKNDFGYNLGPRHLLVKRETFVLSDERFSFELDDDGLLPRSDQPLRRYGGHQLMPGDHDDLGAGEYAGHRYGGKDIDEGQGELPAGSVGFVEQLQRDLAECGFPGRFVRGLFDKTTEAAVRELQGGASAKTLARQVSDSPPWSGQLQPAPNERRLDADANGVVDTHTRRRILYWLRVSRRMPLVIEARNAAGEIQPTAQNLWAGESLPGDWRVFAWDFSGRYSIPPGHHPGEPGSRPAGPLELGMYHAPGRLLFTLAPELEPDLNAAAPSAALRREFSAKACVTLSERATQAADAPDATCVIEDPDAGVSFVVHRLGAGLEVFERRPGGPWLVNELPKHRHCWAEAEFTPRAIFGGPLADEAAKSTFRVLRAVAEQEFLGYFDSVRAWDRRVLRFGFAGLLSDEGREGELGAFLAYHRRVSATDFKSAFATYGLIPREKWSAKYFDAASAQYVALPKFSEGGGGGAPVTEADHETLRSWPWVYRFAMAARTYATVRRAMWDFGRLRLRELLETPLPKRPEFNEWSRRNQATLAHVYRSERAVALLLLWHLRYPDDVAAGRAAAPRVVEAILSGKPETGLPDAWDDAAELALIRELVSAMRRKNDPELSAAVDELMEWPRWLRGGENVRDFALTAADVGREDAAQPWLSDKRAAAGRFKLLDVGLPARPDRRPAKKAAALTPGFASPGKRLGLLAVGEQVGEGSGRLSATAIVLSLPAPSLLAGDPAAGAAPDLLAGEPKGLILPIIGAPILFDARLDETSSARCVVYNEPFGGGEPLDVYAVAAGSVPEEIKFEVPLDLGLFKAALPSVKLSGKAVFKLKQDEEGRLGGMARVVLFIKAPFLKGEGVKLIFAAAGDEGGDDEDRAHFNEFELSADGIAFGAKAMDRVLEQTPLSSVGELVTASFSARYAEGSLRAVLDVVLGGASINLGSPFARLDLPRLELKLDSSEGLSVSCPDGGGFTLGLDLFKYSRADLMTIGHLWERAGGGGGPPPLLLNLRFEGGDATDLAGPVAGPLVIWSDVAPRLRIELLRRLVDAVTETSAPIAESVMSAFSGPFLGGVGPMRLRFRNVEPGGSKRVRLIDNGDGNWQLCAAMSVGLDWDGAPGGGLSVFKATGEFSFNLRAADDDPDEFFAAGPGAFEAEARVGLTVGGRGGGTWHEQFTDLISIETPESSTFEFDLDPRNPWLRWLPATDRRRIALHLPSAKRQEQERERRWFTFELEELTVGTAGFDLKGAVIVENVSLGDPDLSGFQKPLAIKPPAAATGAAKNARKFGDIEFRKSRLVYGSLQAVAQLTYFDDAVGVFTLTAGENEADRSLEIVGSLDISAKQEFHVEKLYTTFEIDLLHLETRVRVDDNGRIKWSTDGAASGRVRFEPPVGRSADEAGEIAGLFKALVVEFENVNPVRLGVTSVTIETTPIEFTFAELFTVVIRGVRVRTRQEEFGLDILGDISIMEMPGIDTKLTFGGLTLRPALPPKFKVRRIGAEFNAPGGFLVRGALEHIEDGAEFGFGGTVSIRSSSTPEVEGLLKLTRVRRTGDNALIPSIAVYVGAQVDVALPYGFYLRNVGLGLGVAQGLRGLDDRKQGIQERVVKFIDDPLGVPHPGSLGSWVPMPPANGEESTPWMFVASGLITYGRLPPEHPHPLAGTILLAEDEQLNLVATTNLWLFTSMPDTRREEFARRPAARGAVSISPRERKIFGYYRTLPNPKMSDSAPEPLSKMIEVQQVSLAFMADPDGFIFEIGWPWECERVLELGPVGGGVVRAGFQFGVYRGVVSFSLNFSAEVVLDVTVGVSFDTFLGRASAGMSVYGKARLQCEFAGALDQSLQPYLYGGVAFNSVVSVRVWAFVEFKIKVGFFKIRFKIEFDARLNFAIRAELAAAFDKDGLCYDGLVGVALSVCGYRVEANVPIRHNAGRVPQIRQRIADLRPRPITPRRSTRLLSQPTDEALLAEPPDWQYLYTRVEEGGGEQLRVVLFPVPGGSYPHFAQLKSADKGEIEPLLKGATQGRIDKFASDWLKKWFEASPHEGSPGFETKTPGRRWELDAEVEGGERRHFTLVLHEDGLDAYMNHAPRFSLALSPLGRRLFKAWLGGDKQTADGGRLVWGEKLDAVVIRKDELEQAPDTESLEGPVELEDVTVRSVLLALHEEQTTPESRTFQGEEVVDMRPYRPAPSDVDDETAGVAPPDLHSPNYKRNTKYDEHVAAAVIKPQEQVRAAATPPSISEGLLASELIAFSQTAAPAPDSQRLARALRLVLVFDLPKRLPEPGPGEPPLPDAEAWRRDPVKFLLAGEDDAERWQVNKKPTPLRPAFDTAGARNYNLKLASPHQGSDYVALAWEPNVTNAGPLTISSNKFRAYEEVHQVKVSRLNISLGGEPFNVCLDPAWLCSRPRDGEQVSPAGGTLTRCQFQFVDRMLDSVRPGDLLKYTVTLLRFDKTELASTTIQTVRQRVVPLVAPVAGAAVHTLAWRKQRGDEGAETAAADWLDVAAAFEFQLKPEEPAPMEGQFEEVIRRRLRLRYRIVPASKVGYYGSGDEEAGLEAVRPPSAKLNGTAAPGADPGGRGDFDARREEQATAGVLPWEETLPVELPKGCRWNIEREGKKDEEGGSEVRAFRASLVFDAWAPESPSDENDESCPGIWSLLGTPPPGAAVEFYVGMAEEDDVEPGVVMRSRLVKCRHAVRLAVGTENGREAPRPFTNPAVGTTVSALEPAQLPDARTGTKTLEPRFVRAEVDYREGENLPLLGLTWRHDASRRAEAGDEFNPVIGYRVYRADAFERVNRKGSRILSGDATLFVSPIAYYRSLPSSVDLKPVAGALPGEPPRRLAREVALWSRPTEPLPKRREARLRSVFALKANPALAAVLADASPENPLAAGRRLAEYVRADGEEGPLKDFREAGIPIGKELGLTPSRWASTWIVFDPEAGWRALIVAPTEEAPTDYVVRVEAPFDTELPETLHGPVWVARPLTRALGILCRLVEQVSGAPSGAHHKNVRFVITSPEPLIDLGEGPAPRGGSLEERVATFLDAFAEAGDPLGLRSLEALGLSCECRLEDDEGRRVSPELFAEPGFGQLLREALEQGAESHADASLSFMNFLAEDGLTTLDVFRVTLADTAPRDGIMELLPGWTDALDAGQLPEALADAFKISKKASCDPLRAERRWRIFDPDGGRTLLLAREGRPGLEKVSCEEFLLDAWLPGAPGTPPSYLYADASLGLRLKGRKDSRHGPALLAGEVSESVRQRLEQWLARVKYRAAAFAEPGATLVMSESVTMAGEGATERRVPIRRDGTVSFGLTIPDRWAHRYEVAVSALRRYDLMRARVGERKGRRRIVTALQLPPTPNELELPESRVRAVDVDRSLELVAHNVLATPLPGSVQALVFVHPAAFAAQATARMALRGQYSGQTVMLRRRINPVVRAKWEKLCPLLFPSPRIDWSAYRNWVAEQDKKRLGRAPELIAKPGGEALALKPVVGSTDAVYGADRYVFPDLPGYYEYQVVAYSTAGRSRSPTAETAYVTPIYESARAAGDGDGETPQPPRQQPRTGGCQNVDYTGGAVECTVRLVHPRFHMRDEVARLWVDAEEPFQVRAEEWLGFGSLPDLALRYILYLCVNPEEVENKFTPVVKPLAEILPPLETSTLAKVASPTPVKDGNPGFMLEITDERFEVDNGTDWIEKGRLLVLQQPKSSANYGELYLKVRLQPKDAGLRRELEILRDSGLANRLVYLSVSRGGAFSEIRRPGEP